MTRESCQITDLRVELLLQIEGLVCSHVAEQTNDRDA